MKKFECKYCKNTNYMWLFKPFAVNIGFVKYSFHVKEVCAKCHKFQRFVEQTPEVIARIWDAPLLDGATVYHGQELSNN